MKKLTLADRLRLPVWLLAAILLTAVTALLLGGVSMPQAAGLAILLIAAAVVGAFSRRGAEAELLAEIERRREAEAASQEANRVKSNFLANMSHELRTPLTAIIGSADLLLKSELSGEDRRHAEVVDHSAEALLTLIDDILDFAKLEAGRLRLEEADFQLRELVEKVREMVAPVAAGKKIGLVVNVEAGVPDRLRGDPARLRQILVNLVNNAVKFTEHGQVEVQIETMGATTDKTRLRLTVRDTGIGISPDDQRRIFETFYQADNTSARRFKGSGLGLSISRELVRRMGGDFGLESERGVGSTFWVELPFTLADNVPGIAAEKQATLVAGPFARERFRILVVDDEPINRRLALAHLATLGFRGEAAASGEAALERLAKATSDGLFDAVLMDCQMASMDGYTTAHLWRRQEREQAKGGTPRRLPIIALTAHALPGEHEKCLSAGMDDYLTKPYRGADLEKVLDRWLAGTNEPPKDDGLKGRMEERRNVLRLLGHTASEDLLTAAFKGFPDAGHLDEMRAALAAGDADALADVAHGLITVAGALGADHVVGLLREIDDRASERQLEGMEELLDATAAAVEQARPFLSV